VNILPLPGIEQLILGSPFISLVTVLTELSFHISTKNNVLILFLFSPALLMVPRKDTRYNSGA
jgi:hypothetical protein